MWHILEPEDIDKICRKLPVQIVKKYEVWKSIVFCHGPDKLREFPGFHDEALKGQWGGYRSSRLNIRYRVIYQVRADLVIVEVFDISPHQY